MTDVKAVTAALANPFEPGEIKFKPQAVKGNRAMAVAYVDCRMIQDRLDEVLGVENWQDAYDLLPDGSVVCKLQVKIGETWITKVDVGSPSEQPDGGDRLKAAFSDALKRAAVKFGIARYLYRLPMQWADYDPVKRQFTTPPTLPPFARPTPPAAVKPAPPPKKPDPVVAATPAATAKTAMPETGEELHDRLRAYDAKLAQRKVSTLGALLSHVAQAGAKQGYGDDITRWSGPALAFAGRGRQAFRGPPPRPRHGGVRMPEPRAQVPRRLAFLPARLAGGRR